MFISIKRQVPTGPVNMGNAYFLENVFGAAEENASNSLAQKPSPDNVISVHVRLVSALFQQKKR